jgi:hypothetical protein
MSTKNPVNLVTHAFNTRAKISHEYLSAIIKLFCMCRKMINWWKRYMYHTNQTEWSKMPRWEKDYNLQVKVTVV